MSVTATLQLPEQPSIGRTIIRPLGGDGYTSPMSAYLVELFSVVTDASGGTASLNVLLDPQYESIINIAQCTITAAAASADLRFDFFSRANSASGTFGLEIPGTASFDADTGAQCMLTPPPIFDVGRISVVSDNIDAQTFRLSCVIFNFKRDAAQVTPLAVLLASLPRGFDITGPFA